MQKQDPEIGPPETVQIVVPGVPRATVDQLDSLAKAEARSRAGQVRFFIEQGLKHTAQVTNPSMKHS